MPKVLKNFLFSLGLERCANGICACICRAGTYRDLFGNAVTITNVIHTVFYITAYSVVVLAAGTFLYIFTHCFSPFLI